MGPGYKTFVVFGLVVELCLLLYILNRAGIGISITGLNISEPGHHWKIDKNLKTNLGHGFNTVVGFGLVVEVGDTKQQEKFADSMAKYGLSVHIDYHQNYMKSVFVTFRDKNLVVDAHSGGYEEITNEKTTPTDTERELFRIAMAMHGVVEDPRLMMFAYED